MNQHEKMAQRILMRRNGNQVAKANTIFTGPSSIEQAEAMAHKILKRRGEELPTKEAKEVVANFGDDTDYKSMTKKQLKAECDALGIEYPAKATNNTLIKLLTGE